MSQSVARSCSVKKVLFKISQNPQESTCVRIFFHEAAGFQPATLSKNGLQDSCFTIIFAKYFRTTSLQNTSVGCFYILKIGSKIEDFDFVVKVSENVKFI